MDSLSAFDDLYTAIEACLIYPDEVIDRLARAFYPAILACWNSEEGQRSLVGARPLHLANARPFGRLKAPLGLSLLRCAAQTQACLWQAEQAHHAPSKEKQSVPDGERPVVHIAIVCGFLQGASGWTHSVFFFPQSSTPCLPATFLRYSFGSPFRIKSA